jgi:hypothetical protein
MPLARQFQRPQSLRQMFGIEPEVGQEPSGIAFNDYLANIPPTYEQQREGAVLSDMDARTNASMADDLAESNKVRDARNMGFEGSYPLREQDEYGANQKLRQILLPKQMELEAENSRLANTQQFTAGQNDLNRAAANERAAATQTGQDRRAAESRAHSLNMARQTGRIKGEGWLSSLFGGGGDEPEAAASGVVMMQTPSGDVVPIPAEEVAEAEANGAVRVS